MKKSGLVGFALLFTLLGLVLPASLGSPILSAGPAVQDFPSPPPEPTETPVTSEPTETPVTPGATETPVTPEATETPVTPGATETPVTPGPGATDTPEATSPPQPPAEPEDPAPSAPPTNVAVGWYVIVIKPDYSLGVAPGFGVAHIQNVGQGSRLCVLEGPAHADTLWWWKLRADSGVEGWGTNDGLEKTNQRCLATAAASAPRASFLPATGTEAYLVWLGLAGIALLGLVGFLRRRSAPPKKSKS